MSCKSFLISSIYKSFIRSIILYIFSQSVAYFKKFLLSDLLECKSLILMKSNSSFFLLSVTVLLSYLRTLCSTQSYQDFLLFFPRSFIVLALIFRPVIHSSSFLIYDVRQGPKFMFLYVGDMQQSPFAEKRLIHSPVELFWHLYQKSVDHNASVYIQTLKLHSLIYMYFLHQYHTVLSHVALQ